MITIEIIKHKIQLGSGCSDVKRTVIKQNSNKTHILCITLYGNDDLLTMNDEWNIVLSAKKSDNKFIVDSNNISLSGNVINVVVTKQMLTTPGTEQCELVIYQEDGTCYFSDTFLIYVEQNINYGSELESTNEYDSIVDTLNQIREYEESALESKEHIDQLEDDINATYSSLQEAVETTNELIEDNKAIRDEETKRKANETQRQENEKIRQSNTQNALNNVNEATERANTAAENCETLFAGMMEPLSDTEPSGQLNGFFWLKEY